MIEVVQEISPDALTSEPRVLSYLRRNEGLEEEAKALLPLFINAVSGRFRSYTGRKVLRARTFRNPSTISCTGTTGQQTLTGAGFLLLKPEDDAVGTGLQMGSRVQKITSDASLDLDKALPGDLAAVPVTFGSAPMVLSGNGTDVLRIPESPLTAVYSVASLDAAGAKTALDLGAPRITRETTAGQSQIRLVNGKTFPVGERNLEVECYVGIRPPSKARNDAGDWDQWDELEQLALRSVLILFQDFIDAVGRTGTRELMTATQQIADFKMPADIREGLARFRRIG